MPTFSGKHGDWNFNNTPGDPDSVAITFTPRKNAAGCKNIRLSQTVTVKAYDAAGKLITTDPAEIYQPPNKNQFGHRKDDEVAAADGSIVAIDHLPCEGDPFYNGDDTSHDTSSKGDATSDPPGPTTMTDGPRMGFGTKKPNITKIVQCFETCAICVDTGVILGCITWKATSTAADSGDITLDEEKEKVASDDFNKALKKFTKKHSKVKAGEAKPRWYCPDTSDTIEGPGGVVKDPFGEPIPDDFKKQWLDTAKVTKMQLKRDNVGGGARIPRATEAIERALNASDRAFVKFSWAGDQTKSVPSVLLTALEDLAVEDVAPFVTTEPRFANDFHAINVVQVTTGLLETLLELLSETATGLENSGGPSTVSIAADLRGAAAAGFVGALEPIAVFKVVANLVRHSDVDQAIVDALHYLALNHGEAP